YRAKVLQQCASIYLQLANTIALTSGHPSEWLTDPVPYRADLRHPFSRPGSGFFAVGFPCSLYPGIPYPMPSTASGTAFLIAARTCSSFARIASGCAARYSSTDLGTPLFISVIL